MKKRSSSQALQEKTWIDAAGGIMKGVAAAVGVIVALLAVCAAVLSMGELKEQMMKGMVLASCVLGCMVGGIVAKRTVGIAPLLAGLSVAGIVIMSLIFLSTLLYEESLAGEGSAGVICACLSGGALCTVFGKKSGRRRKGRA